MRFMCLLLSFGGDAEALVSELTWFAFGFPHKIKMLTCRTSFGKLMPDQTSTVLTNAIFTYNIDK